MKPFLILALGLLIASCGKPEVKQWRSDVLVTVGSRSIGLADWKSEVDRRLAAGQPLPEKQRLLDEIIQREALIAQALELGLDKAPEVRRHYENLLIAELKERELKPKLDAATVRPDEVSTAVQQAQAQHPAQMRLAVLQLTANSRASENKRKQLADRLEEAREKAIQSPVHEIGFGTLAIDYSDDQTTRYTGGDKGWFDLGSTNYALPPELLAAASSLAKVGDISGVIRTARGFYLVRLVDRRSAGQATAAAREPVVQQRLLTKERKRIESEFNAAARSRVPVEINTQVFAALPEQPPTSKAQDASIPPPLP